MKEEAVLLGKSGSLVGIITDPPNSAKRNNLPAFIFLNSGVLHRVGPNRLAVRMARYLATLGFVGCRMDFSGIGDSPPNSDNSSVEKRHVAEAREAMDFLQEKRGIERFVLAGNCSGAAFSFLTALSDPRVVSAVLINPQISNRPPLRYYLRLGVSNPKFWLRTITGKIKVRWFLDSINKRFNRLFTRETEEASDEVKSIKGLSSLIRRGCSLLMIHCEWDPGYDYFRAALRNEIEELSLSGKLKVEVIKGMNHDFNLLRGQEDLIRIVHDWASQML